VHSATSSGLITTTMTNIFLVSLTPSFVGVVVMMQASVVHGYYSGSAAYAGYGDDSSYDLNDPSGSSGYGSGSSYDPCSSSSTTSARLACLLPSTPACKRVASELGRIVDSQSFSNVKTCGRGCDNGKTKSGEWCEIPSSFKQSGASGWPDQVCCGGWETCCESEKLSAGAIVGIVISIIVGIGCGMLGCYFGKTCCFSYRRQLPMAGQVMMAAPATQPVAMGMAVPPYTNTTTVTVTPPPSAVVGTPQPVVMPGSTSPPFVAEPELAAAHEPVVSNPLPTATVVPINIMPPTVESVLDAARVDKAKYLGLLQGLGVSTAEDLKELTDADMDDVGLNNLAKRRLMAEINKL